MNQCLNDTGTILRQSNLIAPTNVVAEAVTVVYGKYYRAVKDTFGKFRRSDAVNVYKNIVNVLSDCIHSGSFMYEEPDLVASIFSNRCYNRFGLGRLLFNISYS